MNVGILLKSFLAPLDEGESAVHAGRFSSHLRLRKVCRYACRNIAGYAHMTYSYKPHACEHQHIVPTELQTISQQQGKLLHRTLGRVEVLLDVGARP